MAKSTVLTKFATACDSEIFTWFGMPAGAKSVLAVDLTTDDIVMHFVTFLDEFAKSCLIKFANRLDDNF